MSYDIYIKFFIATAILSAIPGPTVTLVVHYALMYGRRAGRFTVPAVILGDATAILLAFTSIGTFLKLFPTAFYFIKILGGLYIVYLGIISIVGKKIVINEEDKYYHKPRVKSILLHVYLVTAFNPKSIIFLLAFFPQFINFDVDQYHQLMILGSTFTLLGGICATIYHLLATKIQSILTDQKTRNKIYYFTGGILIIIGINTIFY